MPVPLNPLAEARLRISGCPSFSVPYPLARLRVQGVYPCPGGSDSGALTPASCWARSTIRNAQSIHQRSRKRLSQDTYRRNSVRFLQQRRRPARPGPQSPDSAKGERQRGAGRGWRAEVVQGAGRDLGVGSGLENWGSLQQGGWGF